MVKPAMPSMMPTKTGMAHFESLSDFPASGARMPTGISKIKVVRNQYRLMKSWLKAPTR